MAGLAVLPSPEREYLRQRPLDLVITWTPEGALETESMDLSAWPGSQPLLVELADTIEALTSPVGTWRSPKTVEGNARILQRFAVWCSAASIGSVGSLTLNAWNDFQSHVYNEQSNGNTQRYVIGCVRLALAQYPSRLLPALRRRLITRLPRQENEPTIPYTTSDFLKIKKAAIKTVHRAYRRIDANVALLRQLDSAELDEIQRAKAQALAQVAETGRPANMAQYHALGAITYLAVRGRKTPVPKGSVHLARRTLFLTPSEALAAGVAMACVEGLNHQPISDRLVPSGAPGLGTPSVLMSVEDEKNRRRTRRWDPHALPADASRVVAMIRVATGPGRSYLQRHDLAGADRLIVRWNHRRGPAPQAGLPYVDHPSARLTAAAGWWPLRQETLSWRRLRTTALVRVQRRPQGHTLATFVSNYALADESTREELRDGAIRDGLWALLDNAEQHLRLQFTREPVPADLDMAYSACADHDHHPETDAPCHEGLLACLGCKNAMATPRHLPRLIVLRQMLVNLASADTGHFSRQHAQALARVTGLLDDRTLISSHELERATRKITDADRRIIGLLLTEKLG